MKTKTAKNLSFIDLILWFRINLTQRTLKHDTLA